MWGGARVPADAEDAKVSMTQVGIKSLKGEMEAFREMLSSPVLVRSQKINWKLRS